MLQHEWKWCLSVLILSVLMSACGGGSSSDDSPVDNPDTGEIEDDGVDSPVTEQINGEIQGYLFIADDSAYLNLNTGETINIEEDDTEYLVFPSVDGREFVVTIDDYRFLPGLGPDNDAMVIKNMLDGRIQAVLEISNSIVGSARLSPDRQIVAAIWRDESSGEDFDEDRLTLFSRDGQVLSRSPHQDITSFDWLTDGRLVYTTDYSIYITTESGNVSNSALISTFDTTMGKPVEVSVSPDNSQLAFELFTGGSPSPFVDWRDASIWLMNMDGSGLHLLATTDEEEPRVNSTVWSPDGNWVATVEGYIGGITEVYDPFEPGEWRWEVLEGVPGVLYAVPSSGENIQLPGNGNRGVKPIVKASENGLVRPVLPGFSPEMKWVADIPVAAESRGSLPADSTGVNGGMVGSIYYDDDGEGDTTALHALELQGATEQTLFNLTDDDLDNVSDLVYASRDGQYFSHYYDDVFNGAIYILDRNGQILSGISDEGDSYEVSVTGAMRFSPVDANLLLVPYMDSFNNNETYLDDIVSVIDWSTRTFRKHFSQREYNAADWTPDGNILLAGKDGNVYLSSVTNQNISDPQLHISGIDNIKNIAVSPDGSSIAYTLNRHIWVSDFNGDNFRRLTGFTEGFNMFPEWSPDSHYIAFKHVDDNDWENDSGELWVVAADSENIKIKETGNTPNAIPLYNGDRHIGVFGSFSWR
jgi:hypothetical protein